MKKTLLLVSVALAAMTVNAQEVWTAESLIPAGAEPSNNYNITDQATITEGDNPSGVLTFGTENVSVEAVSTPYPDKFVESPDGPEIENPTVWEISASENEQLINEPVFKVRLKGQGNPTLTRTGAWEETDNGWAYRPGADDEMFVPGTSTGAPQFGTYYKMTFKSAGTVRVGVYINKGNHSFYALDVETLQLIPVSSLSAEGYTQNNTFVPADGLDPFQPVTIDDSYVFKIEGQNRPVLCYVNIPVEAKTYMLFCPKSQLGFYGYEFTAGDTGINEVAVGTVDENAPVYNLAGQRVSKDAKGILIQNGKKFISK